MKIAIAGLGRMGMQIARKLSEDGHKLIAHNRSRPPVEEAASYGATAAYTKEDVAAAFKDEPLVLWLMLPSNVVDAELEHWLKLAPKNSIIIDGGNSDYRLTQKRAARAAQKSVTLLDVGTSGGIWGYERGFCMMAGGEEAPYKTIEPLLQTLAQPTGAYQYFGPSGAGHFVKMVHNAIEYGMMQSLAEGYRLLKDGPYRNLNLAAAGEVWQHGSVVTSWLNELARQALRENPALKGIDGYVAETGEARWALETSKQLNIPMPAIQASFDVRLASQKGDVSFATQLLAAMRQGFGGHALNKEDHGN